MSAPQEHSKLRFALSFAARGIPVHPLHTPTPDAVAFDDSPRPCSCNAPGCENIGKHPRVKWRSAATTDAAQIEKWWRMWPEANIGVATGHPLPGGGFLAVIDIDRDHGGFDSFAFLLDEMAPLPPTYAVRTGGGGAHCYFRTRYALRNRTAMLPGIDIRGVGGYVVGPPSLHASGDHYAPASDSIDDVAWLPDTWLNLIATSAPIGDDTRRDPVPVDDWIQLLMLGATEGGRNSAVARLAGLLIASGLHGRVVLALVDAWNAGRNRPPLSAAEVEKTVRSIVRAELAKRDGARR